MATVLKKYVIDLMQKEKLPFFRIQDSATSIRAIAENDTETDVDTAIELMEEAIASIQDNYVYMVVSSVNRQEKKHGGDVKRYKNYDFRVNLMGSSNRIASPEGAAPMNKQVLDLIKENNDLQRKLDRLEDQRRMDDLERLIKEMKTQSPIDRLLANDKIVDGISGWFGPNQGTKVSINGAEDATVNETNVDRLAKLRKAMARLGKVDKKIDEHIELLADFAEKNSVMYFASIEQVKKMMS